MDNKLKFDSETISEEALGGIIYMAKELIETNLFEYIKNLVDQDKYKLSKYYISPSIKNLIGSLPLDQDYKEIRDKIIDDRIKDYERIS
jgi:hypothetical protein